jgi:hypothetical protein
MNGFCVDPGERTAVHPESLIDDRPIKCPS